MKWNQSLKVAITILCISAGLSYAAAPTISVQTGTVYIPAGESDELTVESLSNSGGTRTYQWYTGVSGDTANPIAGATDTTYTTPSVTTTATYWLRITNTDCSVDSATMTTIPNASAADLPRSQQMIIKLPDSVGIDTSNIADKHMFYITGFSMGAAGVWRWTLDEAGHGRSPFGAVGVLAGNTGSFGESLALAAGQSHVPLASTRPGGATWFDAGPDTPMHAGISKATHTPGTVSVTLDHLNANSPQDLNVTYLSGDLNIVGTPSVFSFANNTGDETGAIGDYVDVDADLGGLDDFTLADGESAAFRFEAANAGGGLLGPGHRQPGHH